MEQQYSPEVLALRDRIVGGNDKLFQAWTQLVKLADKGDEWTVEMDRWHKAQEKLHLLCQELRHRYDYNDCLYLDEEGKRTRKCLSGPPTGFWCQVCPSARPWWNEELMVL